MLSTCIFRYYIQLCADIAKILEVAFVFYYVHNIIVSIRDGAITCATIDDM